MHRAWAAAGAWAVARAWAAAGAGANLALAADVVIAAESAVFLQAFTRIGLIPDAGGTYWLPRSMEILEFVGLAEFTDRPAGQLSGGMKQRVGIARALAMEPKVLLMDEPCSALDPSSTLAIEDLMDELRTQYTIVIVTHNMQQASRCSDKTAFFFEGRLVETGDTDRIFNNLDNHLLALG